MAYSSSSRTRISRPLIGALGLTIVAGGTIIIDRAHSARVARENTISLKAVDPSVMNVAAGGAPTQSSRPEPTVVASALLTQTPLSSASPVSASTASAMSAGLNSAAPGKSSSLSATPPAPPAAPPAPRGTPLSAAASSQLIADARSKLTAGDFLGARTALNDAFVANRLSAADVEPARKILIEINQTVTFSKKRFKDDPFQTVYQVVNGDRLSRIADHHQVTWEFLCQINGLASAKKLRSEQWIKIPNGPFHCVITKSAYRLDVYLGSAGEPGSLFVGSLPVGLGKDNSTPTGEWMVQQGSKAHPATYYSPRGEGVIAATDPKNPLGGYWMGLVGVSGNASAKESYGIHGTIEPDSIGKQASMGCIRLGRDDIALLYELLVDGKSKVIVRD